MPQAMLETRPTSFWPISRVIIESLKTIENSADVVARTMRRTIKATEEPGAAVQRRQRAAILIIAKKAIQGFREPDSSAIDPRIGDSTAMMIDEIVAMLLQVAWAAIGSLVIRETK